MGQEANAAKERIEALAAARREALERARQAQALAGQHLDVTLPAAPSALGHLHPITHVTRDMVRFFTSLGFSIEEGPEVETEYNNFEALNIPADHPARDEQDTFYLDDGHLLRTHTSNVQIRVMTGRKPPFRFIAPGRVYRHDLSPRHSPMFHQIEGFLVDERATFGDLKGLLYAFGRHLMGATSSCVSARTTSPSPSLRRRWTTPACCATSRAARPARSTAGWSGAVAE